MRVPDVNVFINAMLVDSEHHHAAANWLLEAGNSDEAMGVAHAVLSGIVRVTTGAGLKENRRTPSEALAFCESVYAMPAFVAVLPSRAQWRTFRGLVLASGVSGKDISDAYLAAFAIENDATFVTFDRGFARFPGLKVFVPGD